jgi:hypothetical protein
MRVRGSVEIAEALFRPLINPPLEMEVILLRPKESEWFVSVQDAIFTSKWVTIAGYAGLF